MALRTVRQLPKSVGETAGGEPVYEIRSVKLLLDGTAPNFLRLTECSRCGRELAGAPVLTGADLDRPLRPMICTDCIRGAGLSTVWEPEGGEPVGERPAPAPAEPVASHPEPSHPDPMPAAVQANQERLDVMEGHLRAVTDRVNELGRVVRAHQADLKERAGREDAIASALRGELAAIRASMEDARAQATATDAGARQLQEEVAQLARLVQGQRGEVAEFVVAVGETQSATRRLAAAQEALAEAIARPPAEMDLTKVEELITTTLAEAEGRLTSLIASQWGDLETAIESSVTALMAGVMRANEELARNQAVLEERVAALAVQVAETSRRVEGLADRLDAFVAAPPPEPVPAPEPEELSGGGFLDSLDRQLEAAARRLAARTQAGAGQDEA